MKKTFKGFWVLAMALVLVFSIAACSNKDDNSNASDDTKTEDNAKSDKDALAQKQKDITTYETQLQTAMSAAYEPISGLGSFAGVEDADYDANAVKSYVDQIQQASDTFSSTVDGLTIPDTLSDDDKTKVQDSLKDIKDFYAKKAEAAKKAVDAKNGKELATVYADVDKAGQDSFDSFSDKFNSVLKSLDLLEANFNNVLG